MYLLLVVVWLMNVPNINWEFPLNALCLWHSCSSVSLGLVINQLKAQERLTALIIWLKQMNEISYYNFKETKCTVITNCNKRADLVVQGIVTTLSLKTGMIIHDPCYWINNKKHKHFKTVVLNQAMNFTSLWQTTK